MDEEPKDYRFERQGMLPLTFRGFQRAEAVAIKLDPTRQRFELALYQTVGGNWVTVYICTTPGFSYTSVHATCDEAVETMGYGDLARMIRRQLGYPEVEHIA
jgi:hypothetical protein